MPSVVSSDPQIEHFPDEEEDMIQLLTSTSVKGTKSLKWTQPQVGCLVLIALAVCILALLKVGVQSVSQPFRLTVRGILEGPELAEIATDNVMVMNRESPSTRPSTRVQVSRALLEVSSAIKEHAPGVYQQLEDLEMTMKQKEKVLNSVRKFGDSRLVDLTHDITDAWHENQEKNGTHQSLMMHLSKKLRSKIKEFQALHDEILMKMPSLADWHGQLKVDFGDRRLAATLKVDPSVRAQARAMFKAVEGQLGDSMPAAPGRMLAVTQKSKDSGNDDTGLIACIGEALPSLMDACECIKDDLGTIIKEIKDMINGTLRNINDDK